MFRSFFCFTPLALLITLICTPVKAQYFYKDAWNPAQLTKEMKVLKTEKIKVISVKSFDTNGEPSEGFFCEEKIDKNYLFSQTVNRSNVTSQSLLTSYFNRQGLIIKTTDSSQWSLNITSYTYNDTGRIVSIKTFARATDNPGAIEESHDYIYGADGNLQKMTRKKNNTEVSTVNFKADEKGNVIEEEEVFKSGKGTKYFYYYDNKNNLTDVVHYYNQAKRLLPDYMYEYNTAGQIKQMITIEEGGNYFIWKYTYNDQNLRETERCFSKEKKLVGRVEYLYK